MGVFLIKLIYPYCTCICSFLQQHPYFFFHFVKIIFHSLYIYIASMEIPLIPTYRVYRLYDIYQNIAPANSSKRGSLRLAPIIYKTEKMLNLCIFASDLLYEWMASVEEDVCIKLIRINMCELVPLLRDRKKFKRVIRFALSTNSLVSFSIQLVFTTLFNFILS